MTHTVYLHVGLHKTGSSAIQRFLASNAERLLRDGFLYPETGRADDTASRGQHRLAWSLHRNPEFMALWPQLRDEIARSRADTIVISSEEFEFVRQRDHYERLRNELPQADIKVICYLRRQDELLQSEYNQHVKQGGTKTLDEFRAIIMPRLDYKNYLDVLEGVFDRQNVVVRIYERSQLPDGLYTDFMRSIGIESTAAYVPPDGTVNPSLDVTGLEIMLVLNRHISDPELWKRLRHCVLANHQSRPFQPQGAVLSVEERRALRERFASADAEIAQRYMGRSDGVLFYAEGLENGDEAAPRPSAASEEVLGLLRQRVATHPNDSGAREALRLIRSRRPNAGLLALLRESSGKSGSRFRPRFLRR